MQKRSLLLSVFVFLSFALSAQDLSVCSFNIRYMVAEDSVRHDNWARRQSQLCALLNCESPDIFGTQETLYPQLCDLLQAMPDYAYIGVGRDDGEKGGEFSPIFYRKDRLELLNEGHFWLSGQPDKPGKGWDAACTRICTWGYFKDKRSKRRFYFFNTHMDHVGVTARREGAKLIMAKMKAFRKTNEPVILTGDFNVDQRSEVYKVFASSGFLADCFVRARYRFAENGTFNAFDPGRWTDSRIDHVFVTNDLRVRSYAIHTDGYWEKIADLNDNTSDGKAGNSAQEHYHIHTLSDHYPVFVKLSFQ